MRKFLRYLRIAFSAMCVVACVLLIVLWVWSYWYGHYLDHFDRGGDGVSLGSYRGVVYLSYTPDIAQGATPRWDWGSYGADYNQPPPWLFALDLSPIDFAAPHWLLACLCLIFATAPWLPRRFSLRTLLIATTLIAVVLGLIVWAGR